jgi:outer membrane translocation and assembly module TamA
MSGPTVGLVWNTSDGPLNPTKGEVVSITFGQAGKIWGGQYSFYKFTTEAKKYHLLGWETILAGRLKIGFAEPLGPGENLPISERLYAGGEKSVRGYARRKLGPLDARGNPIGGLSLIEGSVELRRPIWGPLAGALFIDFGQVSLRSFDLPVNDLKFGSGFGLNYQTPLDRLGCTWDFPGGRRAAKQVGKFILVWEHTFRPWKNFGGFAAGSDWRWWSCSCWGSLG